MKNRQHSTQTKECRETEEQAYNALQQKRHEVIELFLNDPEEAISQYPELTDELLTFFAQSSNPYMDERTKASRDGREIDFQVWQAAQHWSQSHLKH